MDFPLETHIACQQIGSIIQTLVSANTLYFDQLVWLPDISNGAWFTTNPYDVIAIGKMSHYHIHEITTLLLGKKLGWILILRMNSLNFKNASSVKALWPKKN
jgi:hypothetical protein